ncbi:MAG: hypothetical protein GX996_02230 [Firmicutes bacterium]|nr:hypothetical protein [Bacillota bacterium]
MKKAIFLVVLISLLFIIPSAVTAVEIMIDDEVYEFDPPTVTIENRTLVPMRVLFEALGAIVNWEPDTRTAVGVRGGLVVRFPIDSDKATVKGVEKSMDVPAQLIGNCTYIPLRFVTEALGDAVSWDKPTQTVFINRAVERKIPPIVSTEWLQMKAGLDNLIVLDLRNENDYQEGHIDNAINIPAESFWTWGDIFMELPEEDALFDAIGSCGVTGDSLVVLVGTAAEPPLPAAYGTAEADRVADTLLYAGVKNVAILDGGYPKWIAEKRSITTAVPKVESTTYKGKTNKEMFVSTEYVHEKIGKSVIVDCRDAEVYSGEVIEPFADKAGHIPSARSLPAPWIWNDDCTYKPAEMLKTMASDVIGGDKDQEIIVYCGVGGYASSWWYVLIQILGYDNVKFYDGSAQEWVLYYDME